MNVWRGPSLRGFLDVRTTVYDGTQTILVLSSHILLCTSDITRALSLSEIESMVPEHQKFSMIDVGELRAFASTFVAFSSISAT